jgi:tenascin
MSFYFTIGCQIQSCPNACNHRGRCTETGICECLPGYMGQYCEQRYALFGVIRNNITYCDEGWTGEACNIKKCPNDCLDRGKCNNGTCACQNEYTGEFCQYKACPFSCHGNGICKNGACICNEGYTGKDCFERYVKNGRVNLI